MPMLMHRNRGAGPVDEAARTDEPVEGARMAPENGNEKTYAVDENPPTAEVRPGRGRVSGQRVEGADPVPGGRRLIERVVPPVHLSAVGMLTLALGAWAGICVFVGPLFGYHIDGQPSWTWSATHVWLHLAPGALACVVGLMMLSAVRKAARGGGRVSTGLAGFLAITAGAWLVIGPLAWPMLRSASTPVFALAAPAHNFLHQVGANLGPGILLCIFGALAMGLTSGTSTREL